MMKAIEGFSGYSVTDDGRVWSEKTQRWMKCMLNEYGYLKVHLCVEGKHYWKFVHRLIAEAFLPNPDGLPEVNHRDENKTNNAASNLEWIGHKANINYGTHNERAHAKIKATRQRLHGKPVIQLTLNGEEVARFCCVMEAARQTGFNQGGISMACTGRTKTCGGYRWAYQSDIGK